MLKDKELEKAARFKIGKFGNEPLEDSDLEKIEEINISNRKFSGEEKNVSLEELRLFPNLKRISIQYFIVDNSVAETLNSLRNLEYLQFSSCKLDSDIQIKSGALRNISLNCCEIKNYRGLYAPEIFQIIGEENLRLDKISGKEHIQKMYFQSCRVRGFSTIDECVNLRELNLDGSKVDDNKKVDELRRIISVSQQSEYLPIR